MGFPPAAPLILNQIWLVLRPCRNHVTSCQRKAETQKTDIAFVQDTGCLHVQQSGDALEAHHITEQMCSMTN